VSIKYFFKCIEISLINLVWEQKFFWINAQKMRLVRQISVHLWKGLIGHQHKMVVHVHVSLCSNVCCLNLSRGSHYCRNLLHSYMYMYWQSEKKTRVAFNLSTHVNYPTCFILSEPILCDRVVSALVMP